MATNDGRFARLEEKLLGWVSGGDGDRFAPWRPPTAQEQARWDRETVELDALIERIELGEASVAELDDFGAMLKRMEDEREAEATRMAQAQRALNGDGTSHGRPPMGVTCACGVCSAWRKANNIATPSA